MRAITFHRTIVPAGDAPEGMRRHGFFGRLAAAASALGRTGIGKPASRPLARVRARRAALGFPFRTDIDPPRKADWSCDYSPLEWF